ncbi:hypothetical protein [Comamonas terrae]|uniref:Uncharacterized protein n=1 Tax=Comamonas terrae TaxID=673548 RepID=A0ABW5URJ6_9BURK|nr:hypothetical protein [Comamonas terrae]
MLDYCKGYSGFSTGLLRPIGEKPEVVAGLRHAIEKEANDAGLSIILMLIGFEIYV